MRCPRRGGFDVITDKDIALHRLRKTVYTSGKIDTEGRDRKRKVEKRTTLKLARRTKNNDKLLAHQYARNAAREKIDKMYNGC